MIKYFKTAFIFYFLLAVSKTETDYCQYPCGSNIQTVCQRKDVNCGAGTSCTSGYQAVQLTDNDKAMVLATHNSLRNKVAKGEEAQGSQPPAADMKALMYNSELATIAQCHTNECIFQHDTCRRTPTYSWVGQNMAIYKSTGPLNYQTSLNQSIVSWYNEVANYNNSCLSQFGTCSSKGVVGHYTQLIWANTKQVGCGVTLYKDSSNWNCCLIACNYGTGGNVVGQPVYTQGPTASLCGSQGINSYYSGLCGFSS